MTDLIVKLNPELEQEIRDNAGDELIDYLQKMAILAVKLNYYGVSLDNALKYIREIATCILKQEAKTDDEN